MAVTNITEQINGMFLKKLNVDIAGSKLETAHFFSEKVGLYANELLVMLFKLEEVFRITFTQDDLLSEDVYTLDGVSRLVSSKL